MRDGSLLLIGFITSLLILATIICVGIYSDSQINKELCRVKVKQLELQILQYKAEVEK